MCADADISLDTCTTFDDRERPDAGAGVYLRVLSHHGAGMDSRHSLGFRVEQVGNTRIRLVGVGHDQGIASETFGIRGLEQYRTRLAVIQVLAVLRVGEEAQLTGASLLQGGQPGNLQRLGPLEVAPRASASWLASWSHSYQRAWFMRSMTWRVMSY